MGRFIFAAFVAAASAGFTPASAQNSGSGDAIADFFDLCESVPSADAAVSAMVDLGWQRVPTNQMDDAVNATAFYHVATRATGGGGFDVNQERSNFDAHRADAGKELSQNTARIFQSADGTSLATMVLVGDMPNAMACDIFLPEGTSTDAFVTSIATLAPQQARGQWSVWVYNNDLGPRPGIWAAGLTVIDPDASQVIDFLGEAAPFAIYSRNIFLGENN